jgi:hypothetical protein
MLYKINLFISIFLIILFGSVLISCASEPAPQENNAEATTAGNVSSEDVNLGLKIDNSPEGILLSLTNIPADAGTLFVNVYEGEHDGKQWSDIFGIIVGPKLDEVKETKRLLCPFVKKGTEYSVSVALLDKNNEFISTKQEIVLVTPVNDGIILSNHPTLQLSEDKTSVTLSTEAEFSAPVEYDENKYEYVLMNFIDENSSLSSGIYIGNELSCTFNPDTINLMKEHKPELSGTFSSHVASLCNIKDEGVLWKVLIANTEEFDVTI